MSIIRSVVATGVAVAVLGLAMTACSQSSGTASASADPLQAREQKAIEALHLKRNYKDVVMGTEIKGEMLVVYVDVNNLYSMDEQAEDSLRAQTLSQWKKIWTAAHPGKHVKLRLSLRDYYGNEVTADSARV